MPRATAKRRPAAGRRQDPKPRHIDHSAKKFSVKNRDPDRRYVGVFTGTDGSVEDYESMGYVVESHRKDGVGFGGRNTKEGSELTSSGHVLMSCTAENYDRINLEGDDGYSGQMGADRIAKELGDDPLQGRNSLGVRTEASWESEELDG